MFINRLRKRIVCVRHYSLNIGKQPYRVSLRWNVFKLRLQRKHVYIYIYGRWIALSISTFRNVVFSSQILLIVRLMSHFRPFAFINILSTNMLNAEYQVGFSLLRISSPVYSVVIFYCLAKNYTRWQNPTNPSLFMHFKQEMKATWLN